MLKVENFYAKIDIVMKDFREGDAMIAEKSCGAVVFTRDDGDVKYIIIQARNGDFGFPKGHVEASESEIETARREVLEETGLCVEFCDGFREEYSYNFKRGGRTVTKQVVYFVAEFSGQTPIFQEAELMGIRLLDFAKAIELLNFENAKTTLKKANDFLNNQLAN